MKKISMGNWITIFIVLGNFVWMIGIMSKDVLNAQDSANTALDMAYDNDKKIAVIVANVQETANTALKMAHYNDKQIAVMINGLENIENLIRNGH